MLNNIRNIAILAHADAGKTTITENFLYLCGIIKKPGSVDNGTSQTDFLNVEKERGISVRSAQTLLKWNDTQINLIDTPGHVDFSSDVERVLRIIDGAVLVVSAVEGVQAHTETIWNALQTNNIPTIIFINKTDRVGADCEAVINEIKKDLFDKVVVLNQIEGEGSNQIKFNTLFINEYCDEKIIEVCANQDEDILELYLNEKPIPFEIINQSLSKLVSNNKIVPILLGTAKNSIGVNELLEAIVNFLPSPEGNPNLPLSAMVYSIDFDKTMGKVANVKVFNGSITNREVIKNATRQTEAKVVQVRRYLACKSEDIGNVKAGDIAGICGLTDAQVGDILGEITTEIRQHIQLSQPLLTVQVVADKESDYPNLAAALIELSTEDPTLDFEWLKEERELNLKIMGWIQVEVLEKILIDRFGIKAAFKDPTVIYKETPANIGEGFVQYWMPKPCWAIMKFLIAPHTLGGGVFYESKVGVNSIQQKYQNEVARTIAASLKQGIKGWEVTDIKITLIEGEDHVMHSRPGDFVVATPMGIMDGLVNTGTILLEPINSFRISAPEELLGIVTGDITQMRGSFDSPHLENGKFVLTGLLPVATSLEYSVKLSSRSGGKAKITTRFHSFQPCADDKGVIRPFKGISPLDTAKYILKARKALQ